MEEENQKSLAIFDQMTNGTSSSTSKSKSKMIRFDPNKTEHRIYELDSQISTNGHFSSPSKNELPTKSILKVTKSTTPLLDTKRTYELDSSKLKSLFDKNSKSTEIASEQAPFQFQFFNQEPSAPTPTSTFFPQPQPIINVRKRNFANQQADSSIDEEFEAKIDTEVHPESTVDKTFFFFEINDRLKEGLSNFVRTENLAELERSWPTKRKEIAEALRTKHKKAVQRKEKYRVMNHRRRQQNHGSSNQSRKASEFD